MITYFDTSAIVKLYIDEPGADTIRALAEAAAVIATARVAFVEFHSALARRAREAPADVAALDLARKAFVADWPSFAGVELTQALTERAAEMAEAFALRGYDAVHLASADLVHREGEASVTFACFDRHLNQAARMLGLKTPVS